MIIGRSPLNVESFAGVALLIAIAVRRQPGTFVPRSAGLRPAIIALVLVSVVYWKPLWFPFVHDEYTIVAQSKSIPIDIVRTFTQGQGDGFFRPIGTLSLWATAPWAGNDPFRWHLPGLLLHLANSGLVYYLAQRLYATPWLSFTAMLIFALHGSRPEAVSWMASRFDLLSAFFFLLSLVFLTRSNRLFSAISAALAMLSKEAAYGLPLVGFLLLMTARRDWRSSLKAVLPLALVALCLFAYRWSLLDGIGGYVDAASQPVFANMRAIQVLKALFWRLWALLFFPINWSVQPGLYLSGALALAAAAMVIMTRANVDRRVLLCLIAGIIVSAVPALPLLLVGRDLANSRVLYIPSICFSLLVGTIVAGMTSNASKVFCAGALVLLNLTALMHNLRLWESTTEMAERTCTEIVRQVDQNQATVSIDNLPGSINGVMFLQGEGLKHCLYSHGLSPATDVRLDGKSGNGVRFRWSSEEKRPLRVP